MADVKKIATRDSYGNALVELGKQYDNLVVLDADLAGATKTSIFQKAFPDRHFDCGIAEANMVCMAAGMATTGLVPFASSFAMFAAGRAFEQIEDAMNTARETKGQPTAIVMKTVKGKNVSFMENNAGWHGKAPNDAEREQALAELNAILSELEGK